MREIPKKGIDKSTVYYWLLQQYSNAGLRFYYKKIESRNRQNIERGKPVIIASNHQNSLMDALLLVYDIGFQPVFLTRADIFKGNIARRILAFLKMMPIYRKRDGVENLKRNDEIIEQSLQILRNSENPLCIFPEGNHNEKRMLRLLSKGVFRIAFNAQEEHGESRGVKIVPVGLDYSNYQKLHQTVTINYGNPIDVSEYYLTYKNDSTEGTRVLNERLMEEMRKLMIDIRNDNYYDLYMNLRIIYNPTICAKMGINNKTAANRFDADKNMIRILDSHYEKAPDDLKELDIMTKTYVTLLKKYNFRDWVVRKGNFSLPLLAAESLFLVLLLPIFLLGIMINIIPYYFPLQYTRSKIKDPQMHSSFNFVIGIFLFPAWYILLMIPVFIFAKSITVIIAILLLLPVSGYLCFQLYLQMKRNWAKIRYMVMKSFRKINIQEMNRLRAEIIQRMDQITSKANIHYESSR